RSRSRLRVQHVLARGFAADADRAGVAGVARRRAESAADVISLFRVAGRRHVGILEHPRGPQPRRVKIPKGWTLKWSALACNVLSISQRSDHVPDPVTRGRFISLEGVDGAGKSTHAAWLADALAARGHRVIRTREPGGTPLGEALRQLLLTQPMTHETERSEEHTSELQSLAYLVC